MIYIQKVWAYFDSRRLISEAFRITNRADAGKPFRFFKYGAVGTQQVIARQTKNPALGRVFSENRRIGRRRYAESPLTLWASRETFREAVFLCSTPLVAARISSG